MGFVQGALVVLLGGVVGVAIWKWVARMCYHPHPTQSLNYLTDPEYRAHVDTLLACSGPTKPLPAQVLDQAKNIPHKIVELKERVKAAPAKDIPVESQAEGNRLLRLAHYEPHAYIKLIFEAIGALYTSQDKQGRAIKDCLTRDGVVPDILSQAMWDHLIGPEKEGGTKEPGILRELSLIKNGALEETQYETEKVFLMGYLRAYAPLNSMVAPVVQSIDSDVFQEWKRSVKREEYDDEEQEEED